MAKKKPADWSEVELAFDSVFGEKLTSANKIRKRLDRNGPLKRMAARRAFKEYADDGGDVGDVQSFFEWLVANWDSILKMIMSIISLFS